MLTLNEVTARVGRLLFGIDTKWCPKRGFFIEWPDMPDPMHTWDAKPTYDDVGGILRTHWANWAENPSHVGDIIIAAAEEYGAITKMMLKEDGQWFAIVFSKTKHSSGTSIAASLPEAICRAFLAAVGEDGE